METVISRKLMAGEQVRGWMDLDQVVTQDEEERGWIHTYFVKASVKVLPLTE